MRNHFKCSITRQWK